METVVKKSSKTPSTKLRMLIIALLIVSLSCTLTGNGDETPEADDTLKQTEIALGIQQTLVAREENQPTLQATAVPTEVPIEPTQPAESTEPPAPATPENQPTEEVQTTVETGSMIDRTASQSGEIYYVEEFDQMEGWYVFPMRGDEKGFGYELFNNRYRVEITSQDTWVYTMFEDAGDFEDVRIDITVENRASNTNFVGMICRSSDQGWYEANILNTGEYFIYYGGPEGLEGEMYKGASRLIKTGQKVNSYALICQEEQLSLIINDTEVVTLPLKTGNFSFLDKGQVGVSVSTSYAIPVIVDFVQFILSVP